MLILKRKLYRKDSKEIQDFKIPSIVGWALTHRCNQKCLYCQVWKVKSPELNTEAIFSIIEELASLGTTRICFTGGEPLLRNDIGKIIEFTRNKNILVELNTNGSFVEKKISQIKHVYAICLSLDGDEMTHNSVRGDGSFKRVVNAAAISKESGIQNVVFRTVLSKLNLRNIDSILDTAKKFKIKVAFQPATQLIYGRGNLNLFAPSFIEYRRTIDKLIAKKKEGNSDIYNSLSGLQYLRYYPKNKRINCIAGKVYFHIEPNGMIYTCSWGRNPESIEKEDCTKIGVKNAIAKLPDVVCDGCWNAANLEVNLCYNSFLQERINAVCHRSK